MAEVIDGRYELQRRIGRGGMATVYEAKNIRSGATVAVKMLHAHYAEDSRFVVMFRQEALAAERISHPNVARVIDYGRSGESYYLVEEYVDGPSLAQLLTERRSLQPAEALAIGAAIASALDAAHRIGVVHRDIKPANILIGLDGVVKVTDFGIARAVAQTGITMTTMALGTAYYAPPEQIQGQAVAPASDVYALGAVLFEMLAGRRPFEGANPLHVAMQHVNEDPPDVAAFRAGLSEATRRTIRRMLQKNPTERYADGAQALRAITALPEYVPGLVLRPGTGAISPRVTGRRAGRLVNILLGLLVLALVAGAGYILVGAAASYVREHPPFPPVTFFSPTPAGETPTAALEVPSTRGLRLSAATDRLTRAGLSVGSVTYRESAESERALVVDQSPEPGTVVMPGSTVNLVLGTGPTRPTSTQPPSASPTTSPRPTVAATPSQTPDRRPSPTPEVRPSATPTAPAPSPSPTSSPAPTNSPAPTRGSPTQLPNTPSPDGGEEPSPSSGDQ